MFLSQYIGTSSHIDQWVSLGWNQNDKSLIQIFWIRERFCYFMVCCVCRNGAWTTFFRKTEPSEHVKITGFNFSTIRAMIFLGNLSLSVWQIFSLLVKLVCAVVECADHWQLFLAGVHMGYFSSSCSFKSFGSLSFQNPILTRKNWRKWPVQSGNRK